MFPVSDVIPSRTTPFVTIGVIALNTIVFLIELQLDEHQLQRLVETFGVVPAHFTWASLITSTFLHAGWLHFLGNMLYLWIFGDNVEDRLGHGRYLMFYLFAGLAAGLGQTAANPESTVPMIGASGAIAGVMGAYFVYYPQSRVLTAVFLVFIMDLVEVPALFFLGIWFLMQLFTGLGSIGANAADGGVAFWAHIVGLAVGALFAAVWRVAEQSRRQRQHCQY